LAIDEADVIIFVVDVEGITLWMIEAYTQSYQTGFTSSE
jgi:hypothetical protein